MYFNANEVKQYIGLLTFNMLRNREMIHLFFLFVSIAIDCFKYLDSDELARVYFLPIYVVAN